jgi:ribonuclease HII
VKIRKAITTPAVEQPHSIDWIATMGAAPRYLTSLIAGVDEAGRGPLAGPVFAAAVMLDPDRCIEGLADSKLLRPPVREHLAGLIEKQAMAWGLGRAEIDEIDRLNILQATLLAMQRAVANLNVQPKYVLIDGKQCPPLPCPATAIVRGDRTVPAISAASILAKVARDREMITLDACYPGYGLARHKGYATRAHIEALLMQGPSPCHRRSFAPIKHMLKSNQLKLPE